ncbi:MAG: helix-turn-helix transcriptional regulator [Deltaproteobacteria bacterium]|nr:helix-turn-helix transcriptional regulator [Deltaproteobacteria bacterium]MBW1794551.1 helix-turn-helix transcriptional regulator [Deltaproteobacteria bacterium]MBW2331463.1 helix-turn-helix transcriptional regulator [Deltaproteobacteria bacterium]
MNEKAIRKQLGRRIKILREQKGWRQEDVQDITGFSSRYLGRIERGSVNLTLGTLFRLCEIFEQELPRLFSFMDAEKEISPNREELIARLNSILQTDDPEELRKLRIFIEEIL